MNDNEIKNPMKIINTIARFLAEPDDNSEAALDRELRSIGMDPAKMNERINKLIQKKNKEFGLAELKKAREERIAARTQIKNEEISMPEKREELIDAIKRLSFELSGGAQLQLSWRKLENADDHNLRVILKSLHEQIILSKRSSPK